MARVFLWSWYNIDMIGMTLSFTKKVPTGAKDSFNNPVYSTQTVEVSDCLVAPPTEPYDRVESAALDRDITMVRVHLPKTDSADVSDSEFMYDGEKFRVIGRPVKFMAENTPTRWNRYIKAESING